jgi:hypothetical protein
VSLTSLPAQPRDEGACPGELLFVIRRTKRIAAIAHRFKRFIDLSERALRQGCISPTFGKEHQCEAFIAKAPSPLERNALASSFLPRLMIGDHRLLKLGRPAPACSENIERIAQIVLGHRPVQRHPSAGDFVQRLVIGDHSLLKLCGPAHMLSENIKRKAQIVLGYRPAQRQTFAGSFLQHLAMGHDGLLELRRLALAPTESGKSNA